jgi:hypothetical protein
MTPWKFFCQKTGVSDCRDCLVDFGFAICDWRSWIFNLTSAIENRKFYERRRTSKWQNHVQQFELPVGASFGAARVVCAAPSRDANVC